MRILIGTPWYSHHTGYIENGLPRALAELGHEVMVVTSGLQPGFALPQYTTVYQPFMGDSLQPLGRSRDRDVDVIRLPHRVIGGRILLKGLGRTLAAFRPDVVQLFSVNTPLALQFRMLKERYGYKLFLGAHLPALPPSAARSLLTPTLRQFISRGITRWLPGRVVASGASMCYAVTSDCALVAERVNGVPRHKIRTVTLGVDTSVYFPATDANRLQIRRRYGIPEADVICVYSGRFDGMKNPALLAEAVGLLRSEGRPFTGLFIGGGPQEDQLRHFADCVIVPFMSQSCLAAHFRASDIAVWPFSYSSSQLDALACGLPLVMSDACEDQSRVAGSGATFKHGDARDLARILSWLSEPRRRSSLGQIAASRIATTMSWRVLADERCRDYYAALT